jgi:hypothetical protein
MNQFIVFFEQRFLQVLSFSWCLGSDCDEEKNCHSGENDHPDHAPAAHLAAPTHHASQTFRPIVSRKSSQNLNDQTDND